MLAWLVRYSFARERRCGHLKLPPQFLPAWYILEWLQVVRYLSAALVPTVREYVCKRLSTTSLKRHDRLEPCQGGIGDQLTIQGIVGTQGSRLRVDACFTERSILVAVIPSLRTHHYLPT